MNNDQIKSIRKVVSRDGVTLMFGQRPFGNNQQAVAIVDHRGLDHAHQEILKVEQQNGLPCMEASNEG